MTRSLPQRRDQWWSLLDLVVDYATALVLVALVMLAAVAVGVCFYVYVF